MRHLSTQADSSWTSSQRRLRFPTWGQRSLNHVRNSDLVPTVIKSGPPGHAAICGSTVGLRTHRRFGGRVPRTIKMQGWLAPRPPFDIGSSENATRRRNSKIAAAGGPHRAQRPQLLANAPNPAIRRRMALRRRIFLKYGSRAGLGNLNKAISGVSA
jgi:hypothetical protein